MPVWKYNGEFYLPNNDKTITGYAVEVSRTDGEIEVISFTKCMPYIMDLTFYIYGFQKND